MRRRSVKAICLLAVALVSVTLVVVVSGGANAGGGAKVTVNSTANVDDGQCQVAPDDCTLREAINAVNAGAAGTINFEPSLFAGGPGVIDLCAGDGALPAIQKNVVIDAEGAGVVLDGGAADEGCAMPSEVGLFAAAQASGLEFAVNGGGSFEVRNLACGDYPNGGIIVSGFEGADYSLAAVTITGVHIDNVCGAGVHIRGEFIADGEVSNSTISSVEGDGVSLLCDDLAQTHVDIFGISFSDITGENVEVAHCGFPTATPTPPVPVTETLTPTTAPLTTPTASPTITPTASPTAPATATPTITPTPTSTNTPGPPTSTPRPTSTPTSVPRAGDANCDGSLDAIDATLILQVAAGLLPFTPCPENADVNRNGVADPIDAALVLQVAAGLIVLG